MHFLLHFVAFAAYSVSDVDGLDAQTNRTREKNNFARCSSQLSVPCYADPAYSHVTFSDALIHRTVVSTAVWLDGSLSVVGLSLSTDSSGCSCWRW